MYRTVTQLDSLSGLLAQFFPQLVTRFNLPEKSVQGRDVFALRLSLTSAAVCCWSQERIPGS
jgi:hypothetical protein